ncbi:MAG TPA: hypothetical protein VGE09_01360 [Pseudoxanthomonas sp.]
MQIASTIPYLNEQVGSANVRQCDWNARLSAMIIERSRGGVVAAAQEDLSSLPGTTLTIKITRAHTAGGGSVSGPKWGRIRMELREDGVVTGNHSVRRVSNRPFTLSACGPLDKIADALADDVIAWLRKPAIDPNFAWDADLETAESAAD